MSTAHALAAVVSCDAARQRAHDAAVALLPGLHRAARNLLWRIRLLLLVAVARALLRVLVRGTAGASRAAWAGALAVAAAAVGCSSLIRHAALVVVAVVVAAFARPLLAVGVAVLLLLRPVVLIAAVTALGLREATGILAIAFVAVARLLLTVAALHAATVAGLVVVVVAVAGHCGEWSTRLKVDCWSGCRKKVLGMRRVDGIITGNGIDGHLIRGVVSRTVGGCDCDCVGFDVIALR